MGQGRRKTRTTLIEEKTARDVCLCKRRAGLFKKARELSVLCGAKVGVLVFSRSGKPTTFDAPTLESLISQQLRQASSEDILRVGSKSPPPAAGEGKREAIFQGSSAEKTGPFWWERPDVKSMGLDELKTFATALSAAREELLKQVTVGGDQTFHAGGKMMGADFFPCSNDPSSIHGADEAIDIFVKQLMDGGDQAFHSGGKMMGADFFPCSNEPSSIQGADNATDIFVKQLMDGGDQAFDADGKMMGADFFPCSYEPSSINGADNATDIFVSEESNDEQIMMESHQVLLGGYHPAAVEEHPWTAAATAGQISDFFIPGCWTPSTDIEGWQMPVDETCLIPNCWSSDSEGLQMQMDETCLISSCLTPSSSPESLQMPMDVASLIPSSWTPSNDFEEGLQMPMDETSLFPSSWTPSNDFEEGLQMPMDETSLFPSSWTPSNDFEEGLQMPMDETSLFPNYCWTPSSDPEEALQMPMDETSLIPNYYWMPSSDPEEALQMPMDETSLIPNYYWTPSGDPEEALQMPMDETSLIPNYYWTPSGDPEGLQMPISLDRDEQPFSTDGRGMMVAPNLLSSWEPSTIDVSMSTPFRPLTLTDLLKQNQWI